MKRGLKISSSVVGGVVVLVLAAGVTVHRPRPVGQPGPEAEALAQRMFTAVNAEAWARTGAVAWTFGGRNRHLWDVQRNLVRVTHGDTVTWVRLADVTGVAEEAGTRLTGADADVAVRKAWAAWANDSFWMMGPAKMMDQGTTRGIVHQDDGTPALLVSYASGGVTPGDAYLWIPSPDGTPSAWRMWVSVLPVGGVHVTWEDWVTLPTGVRVATAHAFGPFNRSTLVTDLRGAATLAALEPGPDPFLPLLR